MPDTRLSALRAGPRGLVAVMATTGMREVTANVGLLERSPPEVVVAGRRAPAPEVRP